MDEIIQEHQMYLKNLRSKKLAANEAMKRKFERDCQRSLPNFEIRLILENKFATDSIFISARHHNTMEKVLNTVKDKLPLVSYQHIMGMDFCAPVFLLQETSKQLPDLRITKWVKVPWSRGLPFNRWYRRNLKDSDLKIEIHLRTDECVLEEVEFKLQHGIDAYHNRRFRSYKPKTPADPADFQWRVNPHDQEDIVTEFKGITRAPSTNEWFPERKVRAKPESSPQPKRRRIMETSAETSAGEGKEKAEGDKEKAVGEKKKAEEDKGEGEEAGRGKVVVAEEEKTVSTT
ncbi:hypothetical protein ABEF93_006334 [Exophiala dermatitidis]